MNLQQLEDQVALAQSLLKAAKRDGVYEWGILKIQRHLKECQKTYTKALKQQKN